jgi:hypothetical protein
MPFTPYHFEPGLFVKGLAARWFSWIAFVAVQVVIDCETLYYLERREYPIHRTLHTFLGGTLAGLAVAGVLLACRWLVLRLAPNAAMWFHSRWPSAASEFGIAAVLAGGIIGGASHPLLDGFMHPDIRPLEPWTSGNPLLGAVSIEMLHDGCIVTGVLGFVLVGIWLYFDSRRGLLDSRERRKIT